jgi:hypothetical protein
MTTVRWLVVLCLCTMVAACGKFYPNAKLDSYDKSAGYRYKNLKPGPKNTDSLISKSEQYGSSHHGKLQKTLSNHQKNSPPI